MIEKMASTIASTWKKSGTIPESDEQIYRYGVELLISTSANLLLLILASITTGHPAAFLPYLLSFIPLRLFGGGYHAKAHWSCILITVGAFSVSLLLNSVLDVTSSRIFCVGVGIVSLSTIHFLAPLPAPNKPLSRKEEKSYGTVARAYGILLLAIALILSIHGLSASPSLTLFYAGELMSTVMLIAGKLQWKRRSN